MKNIKYEIEDKIDKKCNEKIKNKINLDSLKDLKNLYWKVDEKVYQKVNEKVRQKVYEKIKGIINDSR